MLLTGRVLVVAATSYLTSLVGADHSRQQGNDGGCWRSFVPRVRRETAREGVLR